MNLWCFTMIILSSVKTIESYYGSRYSMENSKFVMSLPALQGEHAELYFFFTTMSERGVDVSIKTFYMKSTVPLSKQVYVERDSPSIIMIDRMYHPKKGSGHKSSYYCHSDGRFALTIYMILSETNSEALQVVPVSEWGTDYYVMTIVNQPFVHTFTEKGPNLIQIELNMPRSEVIYEYYYRLYGNQQTIEVELKEYEGFSLDGCTSDTTNEDASLAGTHISGFLPIGVISGNCKGTTSSIRCTNTSIANASTEYDGSNFVAEMMMPVNFLSREYVAIEPAGRTTPGLVVILSISEVTKIELTTSHGAIETFTLKYLEVLELKTETIGPAVLLSSNPMQVVYVQRSHCIIENKTEEELGNPSMVTLTPRDLFCDTYIFSALISKTINFTLYVTVVIDYSYEKQLLLNNRPFEKMTWTRVDIIWSSGWSPILEVGQTAETKKNDQLSESMTTTVYHTVRTAYGIAFACYFYGLANRTSFMHTGGINTLMYNGGWGEWSPWRCVPNCSGGIRKRLCDNPAPRNNGTMCSGPSEDLHEDKCHDKCVKELPNSIGKKFLIALPVVLTRAEIIIFVLCSLAGNSSVNATLPLSDDEDSKLNASIHIENDQPTVFELDSQYLPTVNNSYKSTFMFEGDEYFTLTAVLWISQRSVATLQILPVDSWGRKYIVATISGDPSIQIVTLDGPNDVSITFKISEGDITEAMFHAKVSHGQTIRFKMQPFEAQSYGNCLMRNSYMASWTGTKIKASLPVGVVTGSCQGYTETLLCADVRKTGPENFTDIVTEMTMPVEMYGKDFITINPTHRISPGIVMIVAGEDDTVVQVSGNSDGAVSKYMLPRTGQWEQLNITSRRITSNKGILVMFLQRSPCFKWFDESTELGDASISVLVPTSLFVYTYIWGAINRPDMDSKHYVVIVSEKRTRESLRFNSQQLKDIQWENVTGLKQWSTTTMNVEVGLHTLSSSRTSPFGCYVFGIGRNYGFMHSPGYLATKINAPCVSSRESMLPADMIDNDCDGRIDEEYLNYRDDDNDSRVDEDLTDASKMVDGDWGSWTAFICVPNCSMRVKYRFCNHPTPQNGGDLCPGPNEIFNRTYCRNACKIGAERTDSIVDGSWSEWTEWHCGSDATESRMVRTRECSNPPPKTGGRPCFGYTEEFKPANCTRFENDTLEVSDETETSKVITTTTTTREAENETETTTVYRNETTKVKTSTAVTVQGNTTHATNGTEDLGVVRLGNSTMSESQQEGIDKKYFFALLGLLALAIIIIAGFMFCKKSRS